jgi:hypothetical protein
LYTTHYSKLVRRYESTKVLSYYIVLDYVYVYCTVQYTYVYCTCTYTP